MPWSGAPDCPVCHRTVSGAPGSYNSKLATFGFQKRRSAIIHRTVRCATGLSGAPAEQRLASATIDCNGRLEATVHGQFAQKSKQPPEAHRTVTVPARCGTGLSGATIRQSSNGRNRQNPNSWVTWLAYRIVSGAPIDSSLPQRLNWWLGAINTPQPPPLQSSKHSLLHIQYKSNRHHSKDTIQVIGPLKVSNSTLAHLDL